MQIAPHPLPETVDAIAMRLELTRLALGYESQGDFAAAAELAVNQYNQWETGARRISLDGALTLCRRFDLSLDWIFFGDASGLRAKLAETIRDIRDGQVDHVTPRRRGRPRKSRIAKAS